MKVMTVHAWPIERPGHVPFSSRHKARFQELREIGELYAINVHDERLDFGLWRVKSDIRDSGLVDRLRRRFRAAVRRAAMVGGAPYRVNLVDWWISQLAHGRALHFIQGLMERSIEFCEELETRSLELGASTTTADIGLGLYRDRYPCDQGEPSFLYDGMSRSFSDPKAESDYWTQHIWSGFNGLITEAGPRGLRRQPSESRNEYRVRAGRKVDRFYREMKATIRGLSYDLAVVQANYVIDRGLQGADAERTFRCESAAVIDSVRSFLRKSSRRVGLSYRKQETRLDLDKPFREVGEDLRHLISVQPVRSGSPRNERSSAESRQAVVNPRLAAKRWTRGRWATEAGVGKNSVYEYLSGQRTLREDNRKALAEVIGLRPEDLPN